MDLLQIRYFLSLAEALSFTKAAEECGVSQPTLSRAIKSLEAELGGELLRRERGRTHLTELGRMVLPRFRETLRLTDQVRTEANDLLTLSTATLRLGVMCTIGPSRLIPIITYLTQQLPQLTIELLEAPGERVVDKLVKGEIDVALVGMPRYPDTVGVHPLYEERYVVAFPHGHRFARMDEVPVTELHHEPYLERLNCEYVAHYSEVAGPFLVEPQVRYRSEHEDWIQAMVSAGLGCACLPEFMILLHDLSRGNLVDPAIKRTIGLATVRGRRHSPVIALFHRKCAEFFGHTAPPAI